VTISVLIKSYADEKQWLSIFLSAAEQLAGVSYQDRLLPLHKSKFNIFVFIRGYDYDFFLRVLLAFFSRFVYINMSKKDWRRRVGGRYADLIKLSKEEEGVERCTQLTLIDFILLFVGQSIGKLTNKKSRGLLFWLAQSSPSPAIFIETWTGNNKFGSMGDTCKASGT